MRNQMIGFGLALVLAAAAPAGAQDAKAAEILAASRKAIGNNKLDALKTLSVQASVQRNVGSMQMQTESEILLELPDKYPEIGRLQRCDEHGDVDRFQR